MNKQSINLGLFGFGCVGQGLYHVLQETKGIKAEIKKICIKNPNKDRILDQTNFTTSMDEVLEDPDIDVIIELIDDADEAFEIVKKALSSKKAVVTANKKMIAENLPELYNLQLEYGVPLLYEGSCCASIPILRNLEEYYDNDLLLSVQGIFNGSTNYILSKVFNENSSFLDALKQAQDKGFAESDPSLDLGGYDAAAKVCIILLHTFGLFARPDDIFYFGIHNVSEFDISYARKSGSVIKLISKCSKKNGDIYAYCLPAFVDYSSPLRKVDDEYNGVLLESCFSENQLFVGKGAGAEPTGTAVVSDISALSYNYKYEYKKTNQLNGSQLTKDLQLSVYMRFRPYSGIDLSRFNSISEKYSSSEGSYVIGTINLEELQYYKDLEDEGISIVLIEESK